MKTPVAVVSPIGGARCAGHAGRYAPCLRPCAAARAAGPGAARLRRLRNGIIQAILPAGKDFGPETRLSETYATLGSRPTPEGYRAFQCAGRSAMILPDGTKFGGTPVADWLTPPYAMAVRLLFGSVADGRLAPGLRSAPLRDIRSLTRVDRAEKSSRRAAKTPRKPAKQWPRSSPKVARVRCGGGDVAKHSSSCPRPERRRNQPATRPAGKQPWEVRVELPTTRPATTSPSQPNAGAAP